MSRLPISNATNEDMLRFYGITMNDAQWFGWSMKKGKLVKAVGGVVQVEDGRHFAFLDLKGAARYPLIFRFIKRKLDGMSKLHDIRELYTPCDEAYPQARAFLTRLGFTETDEYVDSKRVWKWQQSEQY